VTPVSAKALWWDEVDGTWDARLHFLTGAYAGDRLITDRHLAIRIDWLTDKADLPSVEGRLHSAAEFQLADWLDAEPMTSILPERLFPTYLIDPLEAAGLRIRPLSGISARVFAVCDPAVSWRVAGLIQPLTPGLGIEDDRSTCRAVTA
jgi:hypothetical protein